MSKPYCNREQRQDRNQLSQHQYTLAPARRVTPVTGRELPKMVERAFGGDDLKPPRQGRR